MVGSRWLRRQDITTVYLIGDSKVWVSRGKASTDPMNQLDIASFTTYGTLMKYALVLLAPYDPLAITTAANGWKTFQPH
jgi:hypothetical protein